MNYTVRLLWIKIVGTALAAALPMLLVPESLYLALGFPPQPTLLFLRLYGLSTLALLVGYYGGIVQLRRGEWPQGVMRMGLVSNGGQGLALLIAGLGGLYASWGVPAQLMMWALCGFILAIAMAILWAPRSLKPDQARPA
jgi:hypothetical protein